MCSLKNWTPMFMSSTASRAERPFSGAPAAWEATPVNLYSLWIQVLQVPDVTWFTFPGCQVRAASHSANTPSLAMNAFVAAPSSPGQP